MIRRSDQKEPAENEEDDEESGVIHGALTMVLSLLGVDAQRDSAEQRKEVKKP